VPPLQLSDTLAAVPTPPPPLGLHTSEVLRDWLGSHDSTIVG
jgi:hypothetical protein